MDPMEIFVCTENNRFRPFSKAFESANLFWAWKYGNRKDKQPGKKKRKNPEMFRFDCSLSSISCIKPII